MAPKNKLKQVASVARVNFEAELFQKKKLPAKLKTAKGRAAEGIWGMQEVKLGGEDFTMVFGRTWEGGSVNITPGSIVEPSLTKKSSKKSSKK